MSRNSCLRIVALSGLALFLPVSGAGAWGWEGHKLVCGLAEQRLSSQAEVMVARLLAAGEGLEGGQVSFVEACVWPDIVKRTTRKDTARHHFLNVPDDAMSVDPALGCSDCILVGVRQALTQLSREASGRQQILRRAAALRFLGHYVGDLHQPLHISNASDLGGNRIKLVWYSKTTNLHSVWDTRLPRQAGLSYPASLGLLASVRPDQGGVQQSSVLDWMNASLKLARSHAYVHQGRLLQSGDEPGEAYLERNKPIVIQQLALAGNRLARLLNLIAGGAAPTVSTLISP